MGRIRVLPDLLVNKIAAGEVVERPASVVKELAENAIDAGAGRIAVTIEDGGKQLIRVVDDGEGMSADDLKLAVTPHATSKITSEQDLFAIATMGFRGEALASIGAVSRMRIRSRRHDANEGHEILVAGERIESSRAAGCPPGTTVEVRDLFFNVPARRKFLRGTSTETGHVSEQFARIALAHPAIALELAHNRRVLHQLPPQGSIPDRIARFYGPELAEDLIRIDCDERGLRIEGFVAPPARSRSTGNWQYVFLNGRYIRDRFVHHAVKEAHRGLIEPNRYPVVFLFLSVDPAAVDVNVHPTKIEVRWRDSNLVHSQVLAALREKFLRTDLTPSLRVPGTARPVAELGDAERDRLRREARDVLRSATPVRGGEGVRVPDAPPAPGRDPQRALAGSRELWRSLHETPSVPESPTAEPRAFPAGRDAEPAGPRPPGTTGGPPAGAPDATGGLPAGAPAPPPARPKAIQLHNTYLVAETQDGLVIIDQHALHERILYDKLRRRIVSDALESQRLLLPETINVRPRQQALLESHADLLARLGLEITPFGRDSVAVHAAPAILRDRDVTGLVRDLLDKLSERGHQPHTEGMMQDLLNMMACKAAVKAGDPLTPDEIDSLIAAKDAVEKSSNCPHGRPTALRFSLADLEKQFKRT